MISPHDAPVPHDRPALLPWVSCATVGSGPQVQGGGGAEQRPPPKPSAAARSTLWVGAGPSGRDMVVLVESSPPKVVRVWADKGRGIFHLLKSASEASPNAELVIDVSTGDGRRLSVAARQELSGPVTEASTDRPALYAELRAVLLQGSVVFHLLEAAQTSCVDRDAAAEMRDLIQPLSRWARWRGRGGTSDRPASIPQRLPDRRRRVAGLVGMVLLGIMIGICAGAWLR